jgi:hypothetical protein
LGATNSQLFSQHKVKIRPGDRLVLAGMPEGKHEVIGKKIRPPAQESGERGVQTPPIHQGAAQKV